MLTFAQSARRIGRLQRRGATRRCNNCETAVPITPEIACKHLISVASARSRWKHVNPRLTKIDDPGSDSDRIDVQRPYRQSPRSGTHARNARLCVAARCYTYTSARAQAGGWGGWSGEEKGVGGGQRGVITDDCPLLRHGQSTARNPVHSAGSQGTMIRRQSAMRWTAWPRRGAVCARPTRARARARASTRLAEIDRGHANHSFSPRLRGRSLRGSGRFSGREVNDCLVMPPEMTDN